MSTRKILGIYAHPPSHSVPIEISKCSEIDFKQTDTMIMVQMQLSHSGLYTALEKMPFKVPAKQTCAVNMQN